MDKFGIFKLLNSFLDAYQKPADKENVSNDKPPTDNSVLSAFSNLLKPTPAPQKQSKPLSQSPLQQNMVATMISHDEFVKRVKEKNTQK